MLPDRTRWQRWARQWIVISLWFGLVPIATSVTYYALRKPSDFDLPLGSLRNDVSPRSRIEWAMRIGGHSHYRANIGTRATWFGINVEDRNPQRAQRIGDGDLQGAYQATYLAFAGNSTLPTVITIFREVTTAGSVSYTIENRGKMPILTYATYIFLGSAIAVVFINVSNAFNRRRKNN